MDRIRVLATVMPPLQADIILRIIREQPDMEIVGEAAIESIDGAIERTGPDVVLVTTGATDLVGAVVPLVLGHPELTVLAVDTGPSGAFVEARLSAGPAKKAWPESLVDAIRRANADRAPTPPAGGEPG